MRPFLTYREGNLLKYIRELEQDFRRNTARRLSVFGRLFRKMVFKDTYGAAFSEQELVGRRFLQQCVHSLHIMWNYDMFNQFSHFLFHVRCMRDSDHDLFIQNLKDCWEFQQVYSIYGEWDIIALARFPGIEEVQAWIDHARKQYPGITFRVTPLIGTHKFNLQPSFDYLTIDNGLMSEKELAKFKELRDAYAMDLHNRSSKRTKRSK